MAYAKRMIHPTASAFRRGYADGPQGQIHFYDAGGAGVPLLLLHQSPASSSDWFAVAPVLAEAGHRVILVDTPGMGLSDAFDPEPTMADYADVLPALLDHLGLAKAHLLGHHTGAQIAVEAAVRHPGRISSAILYGAPLMSAEDLALNWDQIVPREREGALHHAVPGGTNLTDHFAWVEGLFGPAAAQRLVLSALMAGPVSWHGHNAALLYDMGPALKAARVPILLVSHPSEMLHACTCAAAALRPDLDFVEIKVPGINALDDAPVELARTVIDFVARTEGSPSSF